MLDPKIRDIDRNHRARRIALWHNFARMRRPIPEQTKAMTNFRWALSQDPTISTELRMRERIFNAFGGRVQRLPMNTNHQLISSTALIERFHLSPEPIVRNEYFRDEQLTPFDRENMLRVKRLSRQMAESGESSYVVPESSMSYDESVPF